MTAPQEDFKYRVIFEKLEALLEEEDTPSEALDFEDLDEIRALVEMISEIESTPSQFLTTS